MFQSGFTFHTPLLRQKALSLFNTNEVHDYME